MKNITTLLILTQSLLFSLTSLYGQGFSCPSPDTLITFDGVPLGTHVSNLNYPGIIFKSSNPSTVPSIGHTVLGGPGTCTYVQDPSIEGPANGTLSLKFDNCIDCISFGFALSTNVGPLTDAVTVDFYSKTGYHISSISADADISGCGFIEGSLIDMPQMPYEARISSKFVGGIGRIAIDNLSYTLSNKCAFIPTLSEWGLLILGLLIGIISITAVRQREKQLSI